MIQEPSHTSGLWYCEESDLTGRVNIRKDHANGDTRILAYAWRDQNGKANARLMAAAPTMLEALQAIVDALGDQDSLLIEQAKDAIRKATQ